MHDSRSVPTQNARIRLGEGFHLTDRRHATEHDRLLRIENGYAILQRESVFNAIGFGDGVKIERTLFAVALYRDIASDESPARTKE